VTCVSCLDLKGLGDQDADLVAGRLDHINMFQVKQNIEVKARFH
jgi:hypothetical protein